MDQDTYTVYPRAFFVRVKQVLTIPTCSPTCVHSSRGPSDGGCVCFWHARPSRTWVRLRETWNIYLDTATHIPCDPPLRDVRKWPTRSAGGVSDVPSTSSFPEKRQTCRGQRGVELTTRRPLPAVSVRAELWCGLPVPCRSDWWRRHVTYTWVGWRASHLHFAAKWVLIGISLETSNMKKNDGP